MQFFSDAPKTAISGMAFELFVINVLESYLKSQKKRIYRTESSGPFDACLPDGIDEIHGPVNLEIKYSILPNGSYFNFVEKRTDNITTIPDGAVLLILGTPLDSAEKQSMAKKCKSRSGRDVFIWDVADFDRRTSNFQREFKDYLINPEKAVVNDAINSDNKIDDYEDRNSRLIKELASKCKNDELTVFLGAGVSIDAGIPVWKEFINEMLSEMIVQRIENKNIHITSDQLKQIVNVAHNDREESPIAQVRYIKSAFDQKQYNRVVHKILYDRNIKPETELLKSIASLCKTTGRGTGVKGVITYNFDDLFENELNKEKIRYCVISHESDTKSRGKLPIYHVHGYMPRDMQSIDSNAELIFSEEDYHRVYRDAYCWSNLAQLSYLRESTCLFVGCSMSDPNLRRMLDVAARVNEKPRHYAILKRKSATESGVSENVMDQYKAIDVNLRNKYYAAMGINIIWVDEYNEIASIIWKLSERA